MAEAKSSNFENAVARSAALIGVMFTVKCVEVLFHLSFESYGIVPRTEAGLLGVLFAPLLHANFQHLTANAIPLFILLLLLLSNRDYHPWRTLTLIWLGSGLGTWAIGRSGAVHVGASSVAFGLAAFLIVAGLRLQSWRTALVAIFVAIFYGGMFYGVLPHKGPISWEGHLSGAIIGAWAATALKKQG